MGYLLLTGATGLLGRYLLRDLTLAEVPLAVVVRPARRESAAQRIETAMAHWEQELGRALVRPVVWEGDVTEPKLGLGQRALHWVETHCSALLHSAASLTFVAEEPQGEPWKSNLHGTRQVLDLLRATGLRQLHHVSTAYVCGLRQGRVLESELDVGQTLGNDYEQSKLQAEQEVRAAQDTAQVTIYRPSIIVGDFHTGYTTTFHGFYTPLRLVHALARAIPMHQLGPADWLGPFQLQGNEGKNFVPVDWVSAAMTWLITHPVCHGTTYHLTHPQATTVGEMLDAIGEVLLTWIAEQNAAAPSALAAGLSVPEVMATFREQMKVYQSYWRNDPDFDDARTRAAIPHLPCPTLDRPALLRLIRFALEANFGWPREAPILPDCRVEEHLRPWLSQSGPESAGPDARASADRWQLGLRVSGRGGGQWQLTFARGQLISAEPGLPTSLPFCALTTDTFARLLAGQERCETALESGRLIVAGKRLRSVELSRLFRDLAGPATVPQPPRPNPRIHSAHV